MAPLSSWNRMPSRSWANKRDQWQIYYGKTGSQVGPFFLLPNMYKPELIYTEYLSRVVREEASCHRNRLGLRTPAGFDLLSKDMGRILPRGLERSPAVERNDPVAAEHVDLVQRNHVQNVRQPGTRA